MSTEARDAELQAALDAWEEWKRLKRRADKTLSFIDCHETAQAWVRFQNLYLGENSKIATMPSTAAGISTVGGSA